MLSPNMLSELTLLIKTVPKSEIPKNVIEILSSLGLAGCHDDLSKVFMYRVATHNNDPKECKICMD